MRYRSRNPNDVERAVKALEIDDEYEKKGSAHYVGARLQKKRQGLHG